jgi:hypothetical protein
MVKFELRSGGIILAHLFYNVVVGGDIMNKNRLLGIGLTFLIIAFIFVQPAYMGPGSKIAKAVLSSFWGLLFSIVFAFTCLPMSIYRYIIGKRQEQQLLKNLRS